MSCLAELRAALIVPDEVLFAEFSTAVGAIRAQNFDRLRALGIPNSVFFGGPSLCGAARVRFDEDGTYTPDKVGEPAVIVGVGDYDVDGWHEIRDLIAYRPDYPGGWAVRRRSEPILGRLDLEYARYACSPARLFANPHEWLLNDGNGAVVLDWNAALSWPFRGVQVLTDDVDIGQRLARAIETETTRSRPDIRITKEVSGAAA